MLNKDYKYHRFDKSDNWCSLCVTKKHNSFTILVLGMTQEVSSSSVSHIKSKTAILKTQPIGNSELAIWSGLQIDILFERLCMDV